jgi:hypothetical protein
MNKPIKANQDLGCDDLEELVERIAAFNHDTATPRDHLSLARALKALAADLTERYAALRVREIEMNQRLAVLDVVAELNDVYKTIAPKKKRRFFFL